MVQSALSIWSSDALLAIGDWHSSNPSGTRVM